MLSEINIYDVLFLDIETVPQVAEYSMLSEKMQNSIISEIEITPEEVRQFFNKIPEDERPVFGAELEISQIIKQPEATEVEKENKLQELAIKMVTKQGLPRLHANTQGSKHMHHMLNNGVFSGLLKVWSRNFL